MSNKLSSGISLSCMIVDDDKITRELLTDYVTTTEGLTLKKVCKDPVEARKAILEEKFDVIFLDVEMPKMSGFDLLQVLDKKQNVIFITGSETHAVKAFEFDAIDYLLKPVSYHRFLKAISKLEFIKTDVPQIHVNGHIYIKNNGEIVSIKKADILWIKSERDYIQFVTAEKKYIALGRIKNLEERLSKTEFLRVHRSYIVHRDKIEKIREGCVIIDGNEIPLSKSFRKDLISKLELY